MKQRVAEPGRAGLRTRQTTLYAGIVDNACARPGS